MPTSVPKPIKSRIAALRQIFQSPLAKRLLLPLAALGAYDTFLSQVLPEDLAATMPRLREFISMTTGWLSWQSWLLILAVVIVFVVFEYAHRLYYKMQPKLVIRRVVHEPELGSSLLAMKHIKIEVRNTGVGILHNCLVNLEDLTSDKGYAHKQNAALVTEAQQAEDRPGGQFTLHPGQGKYIEVASLNEGLPKDEIKIHYHSPAIQKKIPRDGKYYFKLVALSDSLPDIKRFKLYVDDGGWLRMEECPVTKT